MTAQDALKGAFHDALGPQARERGYRGSSPTWRKSNPAGDWVVVNVQSSSSNTSASVRCVVNISAAPEPWLRWQRHQLGPRMPKAIPEYLGLYRRRLHPTGTPDGVDGWWEVSDDVSAQRAVADIAAQLTGGGWELLEHLLKPDGMLSQIRKGDLGFIRRPGGNAYFARAEALMLMDAGPSDALETCLKYGPSHVAEPADVGQFDTWVRTQADQRQAPPPMSRDGPSDGRYDS